MFVLLNGSFGIGKTTTAKRLVGELPGAAISDPEAIGFVLRRLPAPLLGLRRQPPDYQDLALWRRLIVLQARFVHRLADPVVIPMAFTDRAYFAAALEETAPVKKICLVAPLEVVRQRLAGRAMAEGRRGLTAFEQHRSAECVSAHGDAFFGEPVDAMASADKIVLKVRRLIGR